MSHQCVHCSRIIAPGSKEILEGCSKCHGKFFFYIRDDKTRTDDEEVRELVIPDFSKVDKSRIEKDVRSILKIEDETKPVVLDVESVRVIKPGKFEIDLVSLINRKPIVFKLEEGKYIIDIERI